MSNSPSPTPNHQQWAQVGTTATAITYQRNCPTTVRHGQITKLLTRDIVVTFKDGTTERWSNRTLQGDRYTRARGQWSEYTADLTTNPTTIKTATEYVKSVRAGRTVRDAYTAFATAKTPQIALTTLDTLIAAAQAAREPISASAVNDLSEKWTS